MIIDATVETHRKRALVLFSGGLDSTFALWKLMCEGREFDIMYVNAGQHLFKQRAERASRDDVLRALSNHQALPNYRDITPVNNVNINAGVAIGFSQPISWLVAALEVVDPHLHDEVIIGYVSGDQIAYVLHELETAWNSLWKVVKMGPPIPLSFPLIYKFKQDMLKELPDDVIEQTWMCECPELDGDDLVECQRCPACIRKAVENTIFNGSTGKVFTPKRVPYNREVQENLNEHTHRPPN